MRTRTWLMILILIRCFYSMGDVFCVTEVILVAMSFPPPASVYELSLSLTTQVPDATLRNIKY